MQSRIIWLAVGIGSWALVLPASTDHEQDIPEKAVHQGDEDIGAHFLDNDDIAIQEGLPAERTYRGNWFTKRNTVQESFKVFQDIQAELAQIEQAVQPCRKLHDDIIELVQSSWHHLGIEPAQYADHLELHMHALQLQLDAVQTGSVQADRKHEQEMARLKDLRADLERLKADQQTLDLLMQAAGRAMQVVDDQIHKAREYEQSAFTLYDKMVKVLSDDLVLQFAGQLDALLDSTLAIGRYLHQDIIGYFNTIQHQIEQVMLDISARRATLQEGGIDIMQPPVEPQAGELPPSPAPVPEPSGIWGWWHWFVSGMGSLWHRVRAFLPW